MVTGFEISVGPSPEIKSRREAWGWGARSPGLRSLVWPVCINREFYVIP